MKRVHNYFTSAETSKQTNICFQFLFQQTPEMKEAWHENAFPT